MIGKNVPALTIFGSTQHSTETFLEQKNQFFNNLSKTVKDFLNLIVGDERAHFSAIDNHQIRSRLPKNTELINF